MSRETIRLIVEYEWEPFRVGGAHLTFRQHVVTRLSQRACSHWGAAIYKWEGRLASGTHEGLLGILVGETGDIRQRIKMYISGTQDRGNKLWRETFLAVSDARLWVLRLDRFAGDRAPSIGQGRDAAGAANKRLVLEQLMVMQALSTGNGTWVVNARK